MGASTILTAGAFWLSYQHLQETAAAHGLKQAPARAWAWPATVDLFIVIGELLCLRAAIAKAVDWWAIILLTFGGFASIMLNVTSVGRGAPVLDYVVAAMPPLGALLAFGVIMQAIHRAVAQHEQATDQPIEQPAHTSEQPDDDPEQTVYPPEQAPAQPPLPTMSSLPPDLITTDQAMSILGVSRATFGRYTSDSKGPPRITCAHTDANNRKYYTRADVEALKRTA